MGVIKISQQRHVLRQVFAKLLSQGAIARKSEVVALTKKTRSLNKLARALLRGEATNRHDQHLISRDSKLIAKVF